jgi:hypothetical protein
MGSLFAAHGSQFAVAAVGRRKNSGRGRRGLPLTALAVGVIGETVKGEPRAANCEFFITCQQKSFFSS